MDKRTAERLARKIERSGPGVTVQGLRDYGDGSYAIDVQDLDQGGEFVVYSPEQWEERVKASRFWQEHDPR